MNINKLVKLSGISYREFDCAVPIQPEGTYPHNGRAITVYPLEYTAAPYVISHVELAARAFVNNKEISWEERECLMETANMPSSRILEVYRRHMACVKMEVDRTRRGKPFSCLCGMLH